MTEAQQNSVSIEMESLIASAQDSLTDDIVTRLSANLGQSLELLDRINRSGIDRALPAIAQLVDNGDLERLSGIARLIGAMEDSLSDDIVNRLSLIVTGLAALVDKLARDDGFLHLVEILSQEEVQSTLVDMICAASTARTEADSLPPAKGGFGGIWKMVSEPETQEALRFLVLMIKQLNKAK
jgi:uncharacterized protein YjgD (DUF1641 family)